MWSCCLATEQALILVVFFAFQMFALHAAVHLCLSAERMKENKGTRLLLSLNSCSNNGSANIDFVAMLQMSKRCNFIFCFCLTV